MPTPKHIAALACTLLCTALFAQQKGTFTDTRDGKVYKTVKISEQVWMAENLNFAVEGSRCYNDSTAYCGKYGRLYNWNTAKTACPNDWHLPSDKDWNVLRDFVNPGCSKSSYGYTSFRCNGVGTKLKATSGWKDYEGKSGNGEDKYDFSALPGGFSYSGSNFYNVGSKGYWWTASESEYDNAKYAIYMIMSYDGNNSAFSGNNKNYFRSVRCIQNTPAPPKGEAK